ncbi:paraquat-inducible protein A [Acidocella facilis]|uniref:paraquat-inducible protein A n=1 Tax=Acidocella facilis TaxID=525 RepID=UPI00068D1B49|nr:paraquat-inducible protein A [Acidocella facilis]
MTTPPLAPPDDDWRECPHCGLFSRLPHIQPGMVAECPRCDQTLWRMRRATLNFPLACSLAAGLFYLFALIAPMLEVDAYGRFSLARIETGPLRLVEAGWGLVGALVFAVTLVLPGLKLAIMLTTLLGLKFHLPKRWLRGIFRYYAPITPWAMIDVYLLGFLVAYTRLAGMFSVRLDTALYALIGLMLAMAAADAGLDQEIVWRALDQPDKTAPSAQAGGLISCDACGQVSNGETGDLCRRCDAPLFARKPASLSRAWAYTIAAACLYIPANLYPFMDLTSLAHTQSYTIMGGIVELADVGLWPLAALVLFASIAIPLLKLLGMGYMLLATQFCSGHMLQGRTKAYRIIDFIGRWSMIDVFMVSILIALVHFGQFANVRANVGAICFAAVVVLTMFAVNAFDPRLMWDNDQEPEA